MSKFRRSKKEAIAFFEDNIAMIYGCEVKEDCGSTDRCLAMLKESIKIEPPKPKCEYCDVAYENRKNMGFDFESAKYCPMCGKKFKNNNYIDNTTYFYKE